MKPRDWRKSKKMTLGELAAKIGCSPSHISLIETGARNPSFKILEEYERLSKGAVTLRDFQSIEGVA